ncbi:hypothetical protein Unana1_03074 [Umbelopsis nana]
MRAFIRYVCLLGFFGYATVSASSTSGGHECCPASAGNSLPPSTFPFFERYNHRYITVHNNGSDIKLHYIHAGPKDGPVVVLIHGYPETLLEYRNQVPLLEKEGFQVLAFDTRGIGGSEADGIDLHYTSISAATDIHLALKKLDLLKNKIHIVGHDFGVPWTYFYAKLFPEDVNTWILSSVPPPNKALFDTPALPPIGQFKWWYASFDSEPWDYVHAIIRCREDIFLKQQYIEAIFPQNKFVYEGPAFKEYVASISQRKTVQAWSAFYRNLPADLQYMNDHNFTKVKGPVLALLDGAFGDFHPENFAENVTKVHVNSGHFMWEENPANSTSALIAWLKANK